MKRKCNDIRKGAAAAEFALIIPLLLILTFGTIEICSAFFLKETCAIAAHEGARVAIRQMSSAADVIAQAEATLTARGVDPTASGVSVTTDVLPEETEALNPIQVTVTVPMDGNGITPHPFYSWFSGRNVTASCVMYKEFIHPEYAETLAGGS